MAKIRIDQLEPGMVVETARGSRTIQKLHKVNKTESGDNVYIWCASKSSPKHSPYIAARGDLTIEVLNQHDTI